MATNPPSEPQEQHPSTAEAAADAGASSPNGEPQKWSFENTVSVAGVASSVGVATFLIVIIGRLWTATYFRHFGLSSSGLEFNMYDYAFRSLEALISLLLGAIAFSAAWLNREWLRKRGVKFAALEFVLVALLLVWVFVILPRLPSGWLVPTGVLGLSAGLPLAVMIWLAVDVLEGPGQTEKISSDDWTTKVVWKAAGVALLLLVGFAYLPVVSEKLATMEARADLATGRLPAAVLEAQDSLPRDIASGPSDKQSHVVRVLLSQPQNTYVLHSTQCTTIGQLQVPTRVEEGEKILPPEGPDVCKVFAIPTSRLKSVEYVEVRGRAPANESRAHALAVGLDEAFSQSISTKGATDEDDEEEEHRLCKGKDQQEGPRFYNSVWYAFEARTDGALFARAETEDFDPVIGVWEEEEPLGALKPVTGSDQDTDLACETDVRRPDFPAPTRVIGTIAQVQAGGRYVAAVAAQDDKGGEVRASFQFYPGAVFRRPPAASAAQGPGHELSEVLGVSNVAGPVLSQASTATLE